MTTTSSSETTTSRISEDDALSRFEELIGDGTTASISVPLAVLNEMRLTLTAAERYLYASDVARSQRNYLDRVRPSPLTQDVQQTLSRVRGVIGDYMVGQVLGESPVTEDAVQEPEEPLSANPLGTSPPRPIHNIGEPVRTNPDGDPE